jgi:radical SAM protein with 4Fe4S-binding SPASM domain
VSGVSIDYDGNMLLCCQDFLSKYKFGNLKSEKIIDIWNKKKYKDIRDSIKSGIWPLEICSICNGLQGK